MANLLIDLFILTHPHAHACDGYRACGRAHVLRRDVRAHASGHHPRSRRHVRVQGQCGYGCARGIKLYAHVNVHVVH